MTSSRDIPSYYVYGEPSRPVDVGFFHVETIRERNSLHLGTVEPHQHADMGQVTFWTSGSGVYQIEDRQWHFSESAVSFVPSRTVHGFTVSEQSDAIVLSIADAQLAALATSTDLALDQPVFVSGQGPEWDILGQVMTILLTQYRLAPQQTPVLMAGLSATALSYLSRLAGSAEVPAVPAQVKAAGAFRRLLETRFRSEWNIADYADALGSTPHRLDLSIRQVLGCSLKQAVMDRRLLEAKRLLRFTIRPVEDIGYSLGFDDPSYFSRFFRRMTGLSPSAWRSAQEPRPSSAAE